MRKVILGAVAVGLLTFGIGFLTAAVVYTPDGDTARLVCPEEDSCVYDYTPGYGTVHRVTP